ncbi:MAG: exodeoxyribonuclease VII small subunit [Myxococcales bacterium]|nr:MAG: exodeoxyribonuclease VII small subunit [Myxococcales bacterium]
MATKRIQKEALVGPNASFEEILKRLELLVEKLEDGDLPLESAIGLFEEGVQLSKLGSKRLDEAELKVEQLLSDPENNKNKGHKKAVSKL